MSLNPLKKESVMSLPISKIEEGLYEFEAGLSEALLYGPKAQASLQPQNKPQTAYKSAPAPQFRAA